MATLVSPGVSVSVIDESIYASRGQGTVPFILIATGSNKSIPDGSEIAEGTLPENAGKVFLMTSQRELLQTFGDPQFRTVGGNQIHGSPINEYGLLAAHSYLGLANRAYVVRADIDLDQLEPLVVEPSAPADTGTLWLNTGSTNYGLRVLALVDGSFTWINKEVSAVVVGPSIVDVDPTDYNEKDILVQHTVETVGPDVHQVILYYIHDGVGWVELSDVAGPKLVTGSVFPTTDSEGTPFALGDEDNSYWIDTSRLYLDFKRADNNGNWQNIGSPAVTVDINTTGGATIDAAKLQNSHDAADIIYSGTEFDGSLYANVDFATNKISKITVFEYDTTIGNWGPLDPDHIADEEEPRNIAEEGTLWFDADVGLDENGVSTADLLVKDGTGWRNIVIPGTTSADYNGDVESNGIVFYNQPTDPVKTLSVTDTSIWLDSSDTANYPALYRRTNSKWVAIDKTDQSTINGIVFADARPSFDYVYDTTAQGLNNGGGSNPDMDLGVPDPDLYPDGMLLFNTRASSMVVKEMQQTFLIGYDPVSGNEIYDPRWVNISGNKTNGSMYAGADAQKKVVTTAMNEQLVGNDDIRAEALFFNLIATPGFPECMDEMVSLNIDRKETAFVVGDTPFDLKSDGTSLQNWATNTAGADDNGSEGLITADPYVGVYYPSAYTTNVDGTAVVAPASHVALRTIGYNDQVAYPWFAPAGTQRGRVANASAVGYIDDEGEFVSVALNQGQRDVLYSNNINPIAFIPNQGLVVYGQKTRSGVASALDRINVARLVNYIRYQADVIARPFLFEPNDKITRDNVVDVFNRFMSELVTLRGVYDFVVVCDTSNNTPGRIDRNELWIDIAIQPVKSVEFIYIPIRIRNTGEDL